MLFIANRPAKSGNDNKSKFYSWKLQNFHVFLTHSIAMRIKVFTDEQKKTLSLNLKFTAFNLCCIVVLERGGDEEKNL